MYWPVVVLTSVVILCGVTNGRNQHEPRPHTHPGAKVFRQPRLEDRSFWMLEGQAELAASLTRVENNNVAKNVIIFLGDGMSVSTVTAARIYKGQQEGLSGEEYNFSWDEFPNLGMAKTYCVDRQVADSGSTATAYLCGVKTNYYTVGVDAGVTGFDCTTVFEENKVSSIGQWALEAGKRAGFVTSTRVTHATPSGYYSHTASRDWECDSELPNNAGTVCPDTKDIARQLVEDFPGRDFNVIMGGGMQMLTGNVTSTPGDPVDQDTCIREDGLDLYQQWQAHQSEQGRNYAAVVDRTTLNEVNQDNTIDYLMGIFANDHVPYEYLKRELALDLPTLSEMTEAAINVLSRGSEGFVLLVEGGQIDLAHHDSQANIALDETAMLDDAVRTALNMVDTQETLIVVTADHSHPVSLNGYPGRGQDVTGFSSNMDDGLPLESMTYTNGPGFYSTYEVSADGTNVVRRDRSGDDITAYDYVKATGAYREWDTHEGGDVAIYAIGPMSHLFQHTHEQSFIAHAMGYAACIGPNLDHCL